MPDNIKNNKKTDDFNKVKKNFKKLLFRMKSTKTWIFIFFVGLLAAVMIIVENVSYYFFQKNLIEIEMAQLQSCQENSLHMLHLVKQKKTEYMKECGDILP